MIRDGGAVHAQFFDSFNIFFDFIGTVLVKIVSRGFTEGYYYRPRVDMEVLQEFHEGIIALSACLAGEVQRYIQY